MEKLIITGCEFVDYSANDNLKVIDKINEIIEFLNIEKQKSLEVQGYVDEEDAELSQKAMEKVIFKEYISKKELLGWINSKRSNGGSIMIGNFLIQSDDIISNFNL